MPKEGLTMNAVTFQKEGHKYFDAEGREVPSVSEILKHFGISDIDSMRKFIGNEALEASAEFGTCVHQTCALHDQDNLAECDPLVIPWLNGWKSFVKDYNPSFLSIEEPMASVIWGFAGTPDRVTSDGKYNYIVDIKTGVKTVAEEIQTALYQILAEENLKIKIAKRYSIHLSEGFYKIVPHEDKGNINTAKCLLGIYTFKKTKGLL